MKTVIRCSVAVCVAIVAGGAVVAAGGQQKPNAETDQPPEIVLTGCLKSHAADTAIAGPGGRLYTLEVSETAKPPAPAAPDAGVPAPTETTYSLDNSAKLDLEKHADHQVQLTGRMQPPSEAAKERASKQEPTVPAKKPAAGGGHRTFRVTALKMIAEKCS